MDTSTRDLTTAIASGSTEAFADFYGRHFDAMLQEAHRLTRRDEAFCLDVVQDAMMKVVRSMRPMDDETSLRAWTRTLVRSCAVDRLRAEARRRCRERAARPGAASGGPDRDAPDAADEWLRRVLEELEPDQAHLLVQRYKLGWTLGRIGAVLGLSPGAVHGRLKGVLDVLRKRDPERCHDP